MKAKKKAKAARASKARRSVASVKVNLKWPKGAEARIARIGRLAGAAADSITRLATAQQGLHRSLQNMALDVEPVSITGPRFVNLDASGKPTTGAHVAVLDRKTGLEWIAAPLRDGKELNHADAAKACAEQRLLGHDDWRLPTCDELLSIIDRSRVNPATDPSAFKGPFGWTWSSTLYAGTSGYAWLVDLSGGGSGWYGRGDLRHVRAVRASQSLGLTE